MAATSDGRARCLRIVSKLRIAEARGLEAPADGSTSPFMWVREYSNRRPFWIRFVWNPQTGTMIVGTNPACFHHADLMPASRRYPFGAWVRGFYFPEWTLFAIRPFWWPRAKHDSWNESHKELDRRILKVLVPLLKDQIPSSKVAVGINNAWLAEKTGLTGW